MKLNVVLCLTFVSYVLALPRYPPVVTTQPAKDVAGGWCGNILLLTSETIARSIAPFILNSIALSSTLDAFCASGSFFDSDTMSCQPIGITSLLSVRPDGRVECQTGHFWFGPKQTCIGRKDLWTVPPAGYYCPENWVFSAKESCCVPRTPAAIASYSCGNGNGTWDLVRIACIDRSFTTAD